MTRKTADLMQQQAEPELHLLSLSNITSLQVSDAIPVKMFTPAAFVCSDEKELHLAYAAILSSDTDHIIGQAEIDALRLCSSAKIPIFIIVALPELEEEDDLDRLFEFIRNTLATESINAEVVSRDELDPVLFWQSLPQTTQRSLELDAEYRRTLHSREAARAEAKLEIERIAKALLVHAEIKKQCADIALELGAKTREVEVARAKALHAVDTAALGPRLSNIVEELAKSNASSEVVVRPKTGTKS